MKSLDINSIQANKLLERVKTLEDIVLKKNKKEQTTRAQQVLILKHLGILESLEKFKLTKKSKAELLSIILNASADNIEDDLTNISSSKSPLLTEKNYKFLIKTFEATDLKDKQKEAEAILEKLQRKG